MVHFAVWLTTVSWEKKTNVLLSNLEETSSYCVKSMESLTNNKLKALKWIEGTPLNQDTMKS